jgi:hypothetical protein
MLTIDVISDVICPWCFIGKRRLEKALDGRSAPVRWHPFQLNPDMPREGIDRKSYRIRKFGSWERSQEGTISRRILLRGQFFPQFLRGQLEELPEAQVGQLQTQQAVRRLTSPGAGSEPTQIPVQPLQVE